MNGNQDETYRSALSEYEAASLQLYRSELALHDAHQAGLDHWIKAAADRLHESLARQLEATAALATFRVAA